jgi:hypothetical protein
MDVTRFEETAAHDIGALKARVENAHAPTQVISADMFQRPRDLVPLLGSHSPFRWKRKDTIMLIVIVAALVVLMACGYVFADWLAHCPLFHEFKLDSAP